MMTPMMMGSEMHQQQEQMPEPEEKKAPEAKQPSLRERLGIGPRTTPARDLVWGKDKDSCDPRVQELCRHFQIEDRIRDRLNDVMMTREETFESDMKSLWEVCDNAKKPSGYLMVKIHELERGIFTGAAKLGNDFTTFAQRHKLDDRCLGKLIDVMQRREDTKREDMRELEKHLRGVEKPQQVLMPLLKELQLSGRVPSLPRSSGKDSNREGDSHKERERSRDRDREKSKKSRSRSRSRSKRRSKSRSRSKKKSRSRSRRKSRSKSKKKKKSKSKAKSKSSSRSRS